MKYLVILILLSIAIVPDRILIIGDSISAYSHGWQNGLCKAKGLQYVNIAKGGMKTDWMLGTLKTELKKDHNYKKVLIYGGINDVYSNVNIDSIVRHVQQMVDISNDYGIMPIVIVGYDGRIANKNTWIKDKVLEKKIHDNYIIYQEKLIKEIKNATIVPIIPITEKDLADGIHLSAQGHITYVKHLSKFIF
jgi:lysophospholipase L1-like esterase